MADKKLIKILRNIALMLELKGENPFKARAYSTAAQKINDDDIDVEKAVRENTLGEIKGFGKALQEKIKDYVENGRVEYYDRLKEEVPEGLLELTKLGEVGPKKAKTIYDKLGIESLDDLEKACEEDKIKNVKGFGVKSQEAILNSIHHKKANRGRALQENVREFAAEIIEEIRYMPDVNKAEITGEYRRFSDTVNGLSFLIAGNGSTDLEIQVKEKIDSKITEKELESLKSEHFQIEIKQTEPENFYAALHQTTGSEDYIKEFNEIIKSKGIEAKDGGYFENGSKFQPYDEEELYRKAGIQYVPPELREKAAAVEAAQKNEIPRLLEYSDLKGMLHCHSTWSDGHNSIREMALASKELGFSYFAICDHSQSAGYANGLTPDRVRAQHEEVDKLNEEDIGIPVIKGIESDILSDGSLDYDEDTLKLFDMVVVSIHSAFKMSKEKMTRRITSALKSPYTTMLGHPTGRLLLVRPPYELELKDIIDCAADYGKIIEINANPYRLDLPWEWVQYAKEQAVKIAINPDSHRTSTLDDVRYGVYVARKGWLEPKDVVNCLSYNEFVENVVKK